MVNPLATEQFISLVTYRTTGEEVPTAVWFVQDGDRLYVTTAQDSGKVKRIHNNPQVKFAGCDRTGHVHGSWQEGRAKILPMGRESTIGRDMLNDKYGMQMKVVSRAIGMSPGNSVILAIDVKPG